MTDFDEVMGTSSYKTDPANHDTDGDDHLDGHEIILGRDPTRSDSGLDRYLFAPISATGRWLGSSSPAWLLIVAVAMSAVSISLLVLVLRARSATGVGVALRRLGALEDRLADEQQARAWDQSPSAGQGTTQP